MQQRPALRPVFVGVGGDVVSQPQSAAHSAQATRPAYSFPARPC
jgi:hypothetical protein